MDNGGDILQLCRLCLVKDDVNIPIFEEQGDIRQILQKISSCLPVKVSGEDKLPKKICDGCSYKLDMFYEFWNTTANSEKQLLKWLGEAEMNSKATDGTAPTVAQPLKPAETVVKQEAIDPSDIHTEENDDDKTYMFQQKFSTEEAASAPAASNEEPPPPKRARRTAAVKAQIAMDPESDDDEDSGEAITKIEDESEDSEGDDHEPSFVDVPSTSADDQPGPSGVGKDGGDAPSINIKSDVENNEEPLAENLLMAERPHGCDICGKHFMFSKHLDMHRLKVHYEIVTGTPLVKYNCIACNKQYKHFSSLKNHRIKVHGDAKIELSAVCEFCGKRLSSKEKLKYHIRIHTGYKPHACHMCSKQFSKKEQLIEHIRTHTGEKPFHCKYCGKGFSQRTPRKVHERIHTGERPVKCKICGEGFTSKIGLQIHARTCYPTQRVE